MLRTSPEQRIKRKKRILQLCIKNADLLTSNEDKIKKTINKLIINRGCKASIYLNHLINFYNIIVLLGSPGNNKVLDTLILVLFVDKSV